MIKRIQKRPEIADLFKKYAKGDLMTANELCDFFHLEQLVRIIINIIIDCNGFELIPDVGRQLDSRKVPKDDRQTRKRHEPWYLWAYA